VAARLRRLGIETRPLALSEFSAFIAAETEKWSAIIRRSAAKAQ